MTSLYHLLPSAVGSREQHFKNLAEATKGYYADRMFITFWMIDSQIYDTFLEVLPPIYVPGGFLVSEPVCGSQHGTVYGFYTRVGATYMSGHACRTNHDLVRAAMYQALTSRGKVDAEA